MIGGDLEYVLASLPYLSFEDSEEVRSKVFIIFKKYAGPSEAEKSIMDILDDEANKFLNPNASQVFRQINLGTIHSVKFRDSDNKLLASFSNYVFGLKKEIEKLRISRHGEGNEPTDKKQQLPIRPGNPLEEELQLLQLQWDKLESLSMGHYSDFNALIGYKLKLLLLLRWWSFDTNKGFELFEQITKKD